MVLVLRVLMAISTAAGFALGVLSDELRAVLAATAVTEAGLRSYTLVAVTIGLITGISALINVESSRASMIKSFLVLTVGGIASALGKELHDLLKQAYTATMLAATAVVGAVAGSIPPNRTEERTKEPEPKPEPTSPTYPRPTYPRPSVTVSKPSPTPAEYAGPAPRPLMAIVIALISVAFGLASLGPLVFFLMVPKSQAWAATLGGVLLINILGGLGYLTGRFWGWTVFRLAYVANIAYLLSPNFSLSTARPEVQFLYVGLCLAAIFYLNSSGVVKSLPRAGR